MKKLVACLTILALSGAALAGELPANQWVKVTEKDLGVRMNAAVVWIEKQKRFMVLCGLRSASKGSAGVPYEIQTFDPAKPGWRNFFPAGKNGEWGSETGPSKAPGFKSVGDQFRYICAKDKKGNQRLEPLTGISDYFAFDPLAQKVYVILAAHHCHNELSKKRLPLFCYDVTTRTWKYVGDTPPPVDKGKVYGTVGMARTALAFDPVNKEMLFLGGHCPGAPRGSIGNWALSPETGKWRQLASTSKALDPLREKVLAAKVTMRDAMAFARNVFYKTLPAAEESVAMKASPAKTATAAIESISATLKAVKSARAEGWEKGALAKATAKLETALRAAEGCGKAFGSGTVSPEVLKAASSASWALDEAADFLRSGPGPRVGASVTYDAKNKSVMLFGGEHGDYLLSDTWAYDCAAKTWRRLFPEKSPAARTGARMIWLPDRKAVCMMGGGTYSPRFKYHSRSYRKLKDCWTLDVASGKWSAITELEFDPGAKGSRRFALASALAAGTGDRIIGVACKSYGYRKGYDASTWMLKLGPADEGLTAKLAVAGDTRTYMTVVKQYDPTWYDAAPRGDRKKQAAFLATVPANTWTSVPMAPRPCPQRDWGTALFDAHRDQFYHWTGGHMADPATIVSTYHPAINRWSIPYVAEYLEKGMSFNGRPDCQNHTYLNYAFDLKTNKMVCLSKGGASIYDPDRREFEAHLPLPFAFAQYYTKSVGTPEGVVAWERGYLGILDVEKRKWTKLPWEGKLPSPIHGDCNSMAYDSKRNCVWMGATKSFSEGSGQLWKYDMKARKLSAANPKGMENAKWMSRIRESVYLPKLDLVLFNIFNNNKQVAYDPAGNRWVTLSIPKNLRGLGGVGIAMMYDPKRDVVWSVDNGKRMYVLKIDPKTLKITRDIERAQRKKKSKKK